MKLYHGTNGAWLENILRVGLVPRRAVKSRNNWKHVRHQSNPQAVYLSDSYAPFFAFNASRGNNPSCAVIEVDTDLLDEELLSYDEDAWEQIGRFPGADGKPRDGVEGDMSTRTLYWRKQQKYWQSQMQFSTADLHTGWEVSLFALGTCCYLGEIPPAAITRALRWPHLPNGWMMFAWDPSITLINQKICGPRYKALTAKLFGDPVDTSDWPQLMDMNGNRVDHPDKTSLDQFNPDEITKLERLNLRVKEHV